MAAKKTSKLQGVSLQLVKEEVTHGINYLSEVDFKNVDDEVKWVATPAGGVAPKVTTTIEQKMSSYVVLIKSSITQLKYVIQEEKQVTDYSEELLVKFKTLLEGLRDYYRERPPNSLSDREIVQTRKTTDKKGGVKESTIVIVAANIPTQITSRTRILDIALESQIVVEDIEELKKELTGRGGVSIHPRLQKIMGK